MKNISLYLIAVLLFCASVKAQVISKPTKNPVEPTAAQMQLIQQGIKLHDGERFDEAIEKYEQVLKENPDCVTAIYEMALSYNAKGDLIKAVETSMTGIKYKSPVLAQFYGMIGNIWDDQGNAKKALELYREGINILEKENGSNRSLSNLYFNMGITYFRQKQMKEAKDSLKKAVEYDAAYASPNYMLSEAFYSMKYKVPALLAAARLMSMEVNTPRTKRAAAIFQDVLTGGARKGEKENSINIFVDANEPKDEGDFSGTSLILGLVSAGTDISKENKNKSEEEKFVEKVQSLVGFLAQDAKKNASNFVGRNYLPFMIEMKQRGYVMPFSYLVLLNSGNAAAEKWLVENKQKTLEFINWAKVYQPK